MSEAPAKNRSDSQNKSFAFSMKGRLSDQLPWAIQAADGVSLTKDAVLIRTAVLSPSDLSFRDDDAFSVRLSRLANAFRALSDSGWSLHLTAHHSTDESVFYRPSYHKSAPQITQVLEERRALLTPFYTTSVYLSICRSLAAELQSPKNFRFRTADREKSARESIDYHLREFRSVTDDFFAQLRSVYEEVQVADSDAQLTFFHGSLSGNFHRVTTPVPPAYLDVHLADGTLSTEPSLTYDGKTILCASPHLFPHETNLALLASLFALDEPFDLSVRFEFASPDAARAELKRAQELHYRKRKGMKSMFTEAVMKEESELVDADSVALALDASDALAETARASVSYGHASATIVVRRESISQAHRSIDRLKKVANDHGYIFKTEGLNNAGAFFGTLAGNIECNPRKPMLSTRNLAHLFVLTSSWTGEKQNEHLKRVNGYEGPHVLCKTGLRPFYLNLNVNDVGHTLVVGPTGAGKSTLLNFLSVMWLKAPGARVVFFDKDRSAYYPTVNAGGVHIDVGEDDGFTLNPFSHLGSKQDQAFLSQLVADYLSMKGILITPRDQQTLFGAASSLSSLPAHVAGWQTYCDSIQDQDLRDALAPFVSGEYAHLFSREEERIEATHWLTFEMGPLMRRDRFIVQFVLQYLFRRLEEQFLGEPVFLVLDEAWFFLDNEIFAAKMREWLKVLRKKNVYVVLATQEMADARQSTIFSTIVNACMTKILLPNAQAFQSENLALYQDIGLSAAHVYALSRAQAKSEYLYHSEKGSQLFRFDLGADELSFLSRTVQADMKSREIRS